LTVNNDYGRVTNWYNFHASKGSTTIHKMQLRKEHAAPAYHEYILVFTQAGHTYRVERSRDGPVLDAMKDQGVPACDTIAPLHLTSQPTLKEVDETSYSMVELHWEGDKTVDLKLVLDICFQIHNESGKRYKLLTHNCYFFAQTIIMIVVRKTVTCRSELEEVLKCGMCDRTWKQCWEDTVGPNLGYSREAVLGRVLGWELGWEPGLELGWELGLELCMEWKPDMKRTAFGTRRWRWARPKRNQQKQKRKRDQEQEQEQEQEQWREQEQRRERLLQWGRLRERLLEWEWEWKREQASVQQLEQASKQALVQAQGALAEVLQLALSGELEPHWHSRRGETGGKLWYVKQQMYLHLV
jgi:hypothetical protein